jgi:magnesium transporter
VYRSHTFFTVYAVSVTQPADDSASALAVHRISGFVLPRGLITVRLSPDFDIDSVSQRFDELGGQEYGVGSLVHALLDVVVDGHFEAVQALDDGIDAKTSPELDPLYADLYDHVLRASEWTESLRDMITTVFETNLSLQDARLNTVMKKLTGWAAIIAVPTAITGFYGQNLEYPGYNTFGGFVTSTALIVLTVLLLYWTFKRRDWL